MPLVLIEPPEVDPVSIEEARAQLSRDDDALDDNITQAIKAATRWCEQRIDRQFITATWKYVLDLFPRKLGGLIELPRSPVASIEFVKYYDAAGELVTLDELRYDVDTLSKPGRIAPAYGYPWPSTYSRMNAVEVQYVAGYGAAADVPETLRRAILMLTAHWVKNREAMIAGTVSADVLFGVDSFLGLEDDGAYRLAGRE